LPDIIFPPSATYAATGDFKVRADYIVRRTERNSGQTSDGYIGARYGQCAADSRRHQQSGRRRGDGRHQHWAGGRRSNNQALPDGKVRFNELAQASSTERVRFERHVVATACAAQALCRLRDAYRLTGNRTALKWKLARRVADGILPLDEGQIQRMLNTEFGGERSDGLRRHRRCALAQGLTMSIIP
jgi:hypothetical protein